MNGTQSEAYELLKSAFLFRRVLEALHKAGLVGEEQNALVVFIVAASRLRPTPLSLFVKGHSSAGKNFLVKKVQQLLPATHVMEISSTTNAAWNYLGKKLRHKVVYVQEMDESTGTVHPSRVLISENRLVRWVTVCKNGKRKTVRQVTKGPVACISTSTKDLLKFDDESRRISIWVDESKEQTRRIIEGCLTGTADLTHEELKIWHEVQRHLAQRAKLPVELPPWVGELAQYFYTDDIRVRRYFPAFIEALKTVCMIRSFQQDEAELRRRGKLQVRFSDFAVTAIIFEKPFTQSLRGQDDDNLNTMEVVERIFTKKGKSPVSGSDIAEELGISLDIAYAKLRKAESQGSVQRVNKPERYNLKLYVPAECSRFLPDPAVIFQKVNTGLKLVKFVDPLTGKWVTYPRRHSDGARQG